MQKLYYRTTQNSEVPGRQPAKEADENFQDIHNIGQRPTRYMACDGFKAPLVNRLACSSTKAYVPHILGDDKVNKALAQNFKQGFGSQVNMYKPLGGEAMSHADFEEPSLDDYRKCKQRNCKPKAGLTNTLGGLGDMLVKESHEHRNFKMPRYDLAKAKRASQPEPGLHIGGDAKPVLGRTDYDRQYGIEQAERGRTFLKREASLPALGNWKPGLVPSKAVPDLHPVIVAGTTVKRMPMMSPGE
jgi:hypothetical protein